MPEIDFSNVTEQGLEAFCLAYKMRCYRALPPRTITSLQTRMQELGITPDDDRFISLIHKLNTNSAITSLQINTLKRFEKARQLRGYGEEQHLPNFFIPNKGHMVVTVLVLSLIHI